MFAVNTRVYVLLVYVVVIRDSRAESGRVEYRSRTDNSVLGDSRYFIEYISKNVNRVADDYINRAGCILCYLRRYGF